MPFGEYKDFDDCVAKNSDKKNPEAYCATVHKKITGKWPNEENYKERLEKLYNKIDSRKEYSTNNTVTVTKLDKKHKERDIQLKLRDYGQWTQKNKPGELPSYYLKDKGTTVKLKYEDGKYKLIHNMRKVGEFISLNAAKRAMAKLMNHISPW